MPPVPAALFTSAERGFVDAAVRVAFSNPFTPEHLAAQREALGGSFVEPPSAASSAGVPPRSDAKLAGLVANLWWILHKALGRLGPSTSGDDLALYDTACFALLCDAYRVRDVPVVLGGAAAGGVGGQYRALLEEHRRLVRPSGELPGFLRPVHVFACSSQIRRAYDSVASTLLGTSEPRGRCAPRCGSRSSRATSFRTCGRATRGGWTPRR